MNTPLTLLAAAAVATTGLTAAGATRSADLMPAAPLTLAAGTGQICGVNVIEGTPPGTNVVTNANGSCTCNITVAPGISAQARADLLASGGSCAPKPPANPPANGSFPVTTVVVAGAAAGGLAAGLGGKSPG